MVIILTIATSTVYAGGPGFDPASDVPGVFDCWVDGFDDGANGSFNDDRDKECKNIDDQYSKGFEAGNRLCHDLTMHSSVVKDDCEMAKLSNKQQPPSGLFCDTQPSAGNCYAHFDSKLFCQR